jgi:hypothetical protein
MKKPKSPLKKLATEYHGRRFVVKGAFGVLKSCHMSDVSVHAEVCALEEKVMTELRAAYYRRKANILT